MQTLIVGDPHAQKKNLKDMEKLIDFIINTALEQKIDKLILLGDLFHTHAIKNLEVEYFWKKAFEKISYSGLECIALVGNHDQVGSNEKEHINSLSLFNNQGLTIVDSPMVIDNIAYVPYYNNEEDFIKACQDCFELGGKELLVAHQTFTGAQYENGFYSEDGIDPALVPQNQIISGHIHKSQHVGKCFYPGTPKWDTMADANHDKGIWMLVHNDDGRYLGRQWFSTKEVVTPITSYEIKEGDELPELNPNARNYIVLEGKSAWITRTKKKLENCHIKVKPTDRINKVPRHDIATLDVYLNKVFSPIDGVMKKDIKECLEVL